VSTINLLNPHKSAMTVAVVIAVTLTSTVTFAASGSFKGVQGERVSGKATVQGGSVKLSSSFRSTSGPDLYVYLGNSKPSRIVARLRKLSGGQSYALPKGVDTSKYSAVFIHCKRYNHTYGKASLR